VSNIFKRLMGKPKGDKNNSIQSISEKKDAKREDIIQHPSNHEKLTTSLTDNLNKFKAIFTNCSDIIFREFVFAQNEDIKVALVYVEGMVDRALVGDLIMKALALEIPMAVSGKKIEKSRAIEFIKERGLCTNQIKETNLMSDIISGILSGDTVIIVEGHSTAIISGARTLEFRPIVESQTEVTIRGSREAFIETMSMNIAMLRRKIKTPNLKFEKYRLGEVTNTEVVIAYIEGIVNEKIVAEVKTRLRRIKIDAILESGYIEELIEDAPFSPFPTINHTEKPDKVAAQLLEGRVAIMIDGTPNVLTVPNLFIEYLQFEDDYYGRYIFSSAVRILRYFALVISLVLPSFYVAVMSFHHELIPTTLLLSISSQRETVPFPILVEVLAMELTFEILREAGIRLPTTIGQAVSIVGALVIGQAAFQAGFVTAATVIVVAATGIASFVFLYSFSQSFRLLRFPLLLFSATLGLFGMVSGLAILGIHLVSLRSFGIPYLSPLVPTTVADLKDSVIRSPWWKMGTRPRLIGKMNLQRQKPGQKPDPENRRRN